MIKLIASDIDGTLIPDSTPNMYPEMIQAIRQLKEKGIVFCAASGRQLASVQNVFRQVKDEIAYIVENGAHIYYQGKDIAITPMKREYVEGIMEMLRTYYDSCDTVISTAAGSLVESSNQSFIDLLTYGYHNTFRRVEDVLEEQEEIIKIAIYHEGSIRALGEGTLIPAWQDKVKVCMAGEEWVDFMDAGVDKGNALRFLQNYLGVSKDETMAFGDNNNDIGMMLAAGLSYAVENAVPEVKQAAGNICAGYMEKGVYQIVKNLL